MMIRGIKTADALTIYGSRLDKQLGATNNSTKIRKTEHISCQKIFRCITVHVATVACVKQPYCIHACCQSNWKDDVVRVSYVIQNPMSSMQLIYKMCYIMYFDQHKTKRLSNLMYCRNKIISGKCAM